MKTLIVLMLLAVNIAVATWSIDTALSWFGKDISIWADMIVGLILGRFTAPIAIIVCILELLGVF